MLKIYASLLLFGASAIPQTALADSGSAWTTTVARLIASRQNYPRSAQLRGEQGTTRLKVTVGTDGKIGQVGLTQSSGSAILDREAESAVISIRKFPPPPPGVSSLIVPIVWRLN